MTFWLLYAAIIIGSRRTSFVGSRVNHSATQGQRDPQIISLFPRQCIQLIIVKLNIDAGKSRLRKKEVVRAQILMTNQPKTDINKLWVWTTASLGESFPFNFFFKRLFDARFALIREGQLDMYLCLKGKKRNQWSDWISCSQQPWIILCFVDWVTIEQAKIDKLINLLHLKPQRLNRVQYHNLIFDVNCAMALIGWQTRLIE